VESGNIEVIDYQRNGNGGWFVRIEGSGTGHRWSYLHLFEDDSPPRLIDGLVVRSQSPSGEFTLAIRPDTAQFCIIKRSSTGVVQDVFVEKGAGEPPTILGVNARTCVDGGEGFAASGYSGGVDAHLHLQLNRGADNPLLYVNHTPSQQFGISIEKPAHERIKVDKDLKIRFSIDSTAGLDLNKVYVYIDNVPITPAQGRAAFDYGGNLDEDPSRSAEIRHGETVSGVTFEVKPRDSDPRLDGIQTGLDEFWISGIKASGPFGSLGQHTVSVSAYNLKGKWEGAVQSVTVDSVVFRVIE
jgi:hypothetical protein